jgi:tRNA threonylcarbamoyladenosine biosynthesis protein TsaE
VKTQHISTSLETTGKIAGDLAKKAIPGSVFALIGDLGTGKTHFTKAFAKTLGIKEEITSPTFALLEEYENIPPFYHFDLYRIENDEEFNFLNFEEYWESSGISIIEWADRAYERLPKNAVKIYLTYIDENTRRIEIEYPDT